MKLKDLAKAANVSESTASKALKGSKEIHEDTIRHVLKVAEESGYFLEQKKQRKEQSKTNGKVIIVVPEVVSVYYSVLATAITEKLRNQNIESQICYYNFQSELKDSIFLQSLRDVRVSGIIMLDAVDDRLMTLSDFPVLSTVNNPLFDADRTFGLEKAVKHLIELGHKKICFFGEKLTVFKSQCFNELVQKYNLDKEKCKCFLSEYRFERAGFTLANGLMNWEDLPTAIICAYDEIAFGAMSAFMQKGIRIPNDISVIGINDVPSAKYYPVPLTTLAYSTDEYCDKIIGVLNGMMENSNEQKGCSVNMNLIVRASTAKAKN